MECISGAVCPFFDSFPPDSSSLRFCCCAVDDASPVAEIEVKPVVKVADPKAGG